MVALVSSAREAPAGRCSMRMILSVFVPYRAAGALMSTTSLPPLRETLTRGLAASDLVVVLLAGASAGLDIETIMYFLLLRQAAAVLSFIPRVAGECNRETLRKQ